MKILYTFASRSRPEKFLKCLDNIYHNAKHTDFTINASLDVDDPSMHTEAMREQLGNYANLTIRWGFSKNKIDAINRAVGDTDFDVLVNMSDDMLFIQKGFDKIITDAFRVSASPDSSQFDLDQLIHFPDQNQGDNCMTMYIAGRDYYKRDGYIYNPECKSLWADIISQETGQARGKYKYVPERIFNHLHPSFGQCQYDTQYRQTESMEVRQHDYDVYLAAKKIYDPTNQFKTRGI